MKRKLIYTSTGLGLIVFTGLFAMLLGIAEIFSGEINQYITEILSSLLGCLYLTLLFARLKSHDWESKRERNENIRLCLMGLLFFAARSINRILCGLFIHKGRPVIGYGLGVLIDLCLLIGLFLLLPKEIHSVPSAGTENIDAE